MKTLNHLILSAVLLAGAASYAAAADRDGLRDVYDICADTESKIQTQVLDPILGMGRAYVFLEAGAELVSSAERESKSGRGKMHKAQAKAEEGKGADKDAMQEQTASQEKNSSEARRSLRMELSGMKLRILHDSSVPAKALKEVKEALLALYPGRLKAGDIVFIAAPFSPEGEMGEASAG